MTTTIQIHVNGRYRADVSRNGETPVEVHGNYEGSPNPSGGYSFNLTHGSTPTSFTVIEHMVPEEVKQDAQTIGEGDVGKLPEGLRNPAT